MKHVLAGALALAVCGSASAADGLKLGIGADYSSGKYGTDTETTILSVPLSAAWTTGDWTFKASVPWMRVDGDPNVVPGLGEVGNSNPKGRGRGKGNSPSPSPTPSPVAESGAASGLGDVRLSARYSLPLQSAVGVDLTAHAKLATADEDKGLGTGSNDVGLSADLYRAFGDTTVFGGAGYTWLGDSDYIDVDAVANASVGVSQKVGERRQVGVAYDWREAASATADARSELTAFYGFPGGERADWQVYAVAGLSDGSPDWGAGVALTMGF